MASVVSARAGVNYCRSGLRAIRFREEHALRFPVGRVVEADSLVSIGRVVAWPGDRFVFFAHSSVCKSLFSAAEDSMLSSGLLD